MKKIITILLLTAFMVPSTFASTSGLIYSEDGSMVMDNVPGANRKASCLWYLKNFRRFLPEWREATKSEAIRNEIDRILGQ